MVTFVLIYNNFNVFGRPPVGHTIKTNFYNISDCWSRDILSSILTFYRRVGLRKIFLVLYSINWPNFIVWLPLLLEILDNTCISIICCPVCDVRNFEINLDFLFKPIFCITKSQDKSLNISRTKRTFKIK